MGSNGVKPDKPTFSDLIKAIKTHDTRAVLDLIAAGADVNQPNGAGVTPLMVAVEYVEEFDIIRTLVERSARVTAKDKSGKSVIDRIEIPPAPPEEHENAYEAWAHSDEGFVLMYLLRKQREEWVAAGTFGP
ncbi:MAG: ankyrin repeat domain-containing protein [Anaerolineae bacterium]